MNDEMLHEEEWKGWVVAAGMLYWVQGVVGEFILDYAAYDPEFCAMAEAKSFRGGVLTLAPHNAATFLQALHARAVTPAEREALQSGAEQEGSDVIAWIDVDARRFVHAYFDLPLEAYAPSGWKAAMGNPVKELKEWLRKQ